MSHRNLSTALALGAAVAFLGIVPASNMTLLSSTFASGTAMPSSVACKRESGQDRSPELHWSNVPAETSQFALIEHDADAPMAGGFYHWVFYRLPATQRSIRADTPRPDGAIVGTTSANASGIKDRGYFGACPPPGPAHHYTFTLYALDRGFRASPQTSFTGPQLVAQMRGHILAQAALVGTYRR